MFVECPVLASRARKQIGFRGVEHLANQKVAIFVVLRRLGVGDWTFGHAFPLRDYFSAKTE
jgi:hypothetical protein